VRSPDWCWRLVSDGGAHAVPLGTLYRYLQGQTSLYQNNNTRQLIRGQRNTMMDTGRRVHLHTQLVISADDGQAGTSTCRTYLVTAKFFRNVAPSPATAAKNTLTASTGRTSPELTAAGA
jgi:hypothetical protein